MADPLPTEPLALTYWLETSPVLLATLADQSGLKPFEVAELLVEVERELMTQPQTDVSENLVVFAYLDLVRTPHHGKHTSFV